MSDSARPALTAYTRTGVPRSVIHELRTPLTSIHGYAQLLPRAMKNPERCQSACDTILRQTQRLAAMLEKLARVADVMDGSSDRPPAPTTLGSVLDSAVDAARWRWSGHTIVLQREQDAMVMADRLRLKELIEVLIDNAASYSPTGSRIELMLNHRDGEAHLAVRDEGIGIPADELEAIFDCFVRGSNVSQAGWSGAHGMGIGLFIARATAAEAGGRLWAERDQSRGSTFHLTLPAAPEQVPSPAGS